MKRGEVWWARIDKKRPVVILSRDEGGEIRAMVIVDPAGVDIRSIAVEVRVGVREGLPRDGVLRVALPRPGHVYCNWLVTLQGVDLIERVGVLSSAKLHEVDDLLRIGELEWFFKQR